MVKMCDKIVERPPIRDACTGEVVCAVCGEVLSDKEENCDSEMMWRLGIKDRED